MNQKQTLQIASILGVLAVGIGAFGAHVFKPALISMGRLETYELAVRYQFYHALALLMVGILMKQYNSPKLSYASLFFVVGTVFFSGSLYMLCFTGINKLGAITPIGGVFFILGWAFIFFGVKENKL